jgi:ADP-heptose:LPS heptosyltransferase
VDDAIALDKHLFDRPASLLRPPTLASLLRLLWRIRRERCDSVVLFHHFLSPWGTLKLALLALCSGARERVGLARGRRWFLTHAAHDRGLGARHEAEYWLDVVSLLGAHGPLRLEAPVSEDDRAAAARLLTDSGADAGKLLAIHPGTGWYGPGRRWPADRFARAATMILEVEPMSCVILGTTGEAQEAAEVSRLLGSRAVNLVGRTSLGELGAVLERSAVLLANDGGVAHLAAAVGTPAITVFGPSNDRAWRPLMGRVVALDLACRPCFYRDFRTGLREGVPPRDCMMLVTPRMVANAALDVLAERRLAV